MFISAYVCYVMPDINKHFKQLCREQPEKNKICSFSQMSVFICNTAKTLTLPKEKLDNKDHKRLYLLKSCLLRSMEKRKRSARSALFCNISSNSLSSTSSDSRLGKISFPRMYTPFACTMFCAFVSFRESCVSAAQHAKRGCVCSVKVFDINSKCNLGKFQA